MSDWMAQGRKRPKRRWWAVAARPIPGSMPLDIITTPGVAMVAAYGLRQMRSGYVGPAVNIRRSSDNATQAIGFRGAGDFDVQTFSNFVGGGTGYVATWYDQTPNGSNATAFGGDITTQPPIALAITPNGRPVVQFTAGGTGGWQGLSAPTAASQSLISFSVVCNRTGNLTNFGMMLGVDGSNPVITYVNSAGGGISVGNYGTGVVGAAACTDNAFHAAVAAMNGANTFCTVDNSVTGTGSQAGNAGATQIDIAGRNSYIFLGYLAEGMIWNGVLGANDIAALNTNQHAYYGF